MAAPWNIIRRRLVYEITALSVLLVVVTIAFFAVAIYRVERESVQERFGLALERIVATAALDIDGDVHARVRSADDPAFRTVRDHLRRVQEANYLGEEQLYTFRIDDLDAGRLQFAVMLQEETFVGDPYTLVAQNRPAFRRAVEEQVATHTRLYEDDHGIWVSAYAPIVDAAGQVTGVLEADYRVEAFLAEMEESLARLLLTSLLAVALALLLSIFLGRGIGRALEKIRQGALAIANQDYDFRVELDREDELGLVAKQLNALSGTLKERFLLLKFIPRHTLEAVESAARGDTDPQESERVEGTIVFTDIRGYTAMSANRPAEEVVAILNRYLRVQAEAFQKHGGVVDKFIGDAVLAVFRGRAHEDRAVAASLEAQSAVDALNREGVDTPVHIGIGISSGELVLGEIGSDARKERTVIGSVVNLAARLCSHAGAGEVVVSDAVRAEATCVVERTEEVPLKGFSAPQPVHILTAGACALPDAPSSPTADS